MSGFSLITLSPLIICYDFFKKKLPILFEIDLALISVGNFVVAALAPLTFSLPQPARGLKLSLSFFLLSVSN